jgi:hypothetical protein
MIRSIRLILIEVIFLEKKKTVINFLLFVSWPDYLKHSLFLPIGYAGTLIHLEWPPQSPDLSPIEQIWDYVKSKMDTTERSSKEVMWQKIQKEWNKIPKKVLRKYILSLKSRCAACLNAKGYTKY